MNSLKLNGYQREMLVIKITKKISDAEKSWMMMRYKNRKRKLSAGRRMLEELWTINFSMLND